MSASTSASVEHCEAMAAQFSDMAESYYNPLKDYCQQKLWHQLTLKSLDFLTKKETTLRPVADSNTHIALYEKVLLVVAPRLNSLALGRMAAAVAWNSLPQTGAAKSQALLQTLLDDQKKKSNNVPTILFLQSQLALLELRQDNKPSKEQLDAIYATIKANAPLLNQLMPDTEEAMIVNASHYEMSMSYYKIVGPPEAFYEEAIHYLNYYQPTPENQAKSHALAVDLCLAALTGEGVYNLGQIVTNPILQVGLANTSEAWLMELLQACAAGHVGNFKQLVQVTYPSQIAAQPALVNMGQALQEKMTLLALVQMVFERPSSERTLTFDDITQRLEIPMDQVEWVLMRAFSVKLLEGEMDQVDGTVHITWVLPRTLTTDQMSDLATRFGDWATKVQTTKEYMQEQTPTLTA